MAGAVIVVLVMVLLGPIGLFVGGALWSAFIGRALVEDRDRAATSEVAASEAA
jgi:hypothetical protein